MTSELGSTGSNNGDHRDVVRHMRAQLRSTMWWGLVALGIGCVGGTVILWTGTGVRKMTRDEIHAALPWGPNREALLSRVREFALHDIRLLKQWAQKGEGREREIAANAIEHIKKELFR